MELLKFCLLRKISVFFTWTQEEDMGFLDWLFCELLVSEEHWPRIETKYAKAIVNREDIITSE